MKWLIYGSRGWIGTQFVSILESMEGEDVVYAEARADDEVAVKNELEKVKPDRIVSLIGRTHGPGYSTIDYLEQKGKLVENVRDNLYSPLILAILAHQNAIHFTYLGTGCIFDGYPENGGFTEEDRPNFFGSSYSTVKGFTDRLMHMFTDNVLNVRIRMPISDSHNPRNFITKIMNYKKICSITNSMTVLPELLPIMIDMAKNRETGTINLTNPGTISHNEILEMVKEMIDPNFTWENFTIEEQNKILASGRSNNSLDTTRLESLYPYVTPIKEAIRNVLKNY